MGQASAGLTWPVKTNGHHGMTMQHKLHNQRGSQVGCAMEEGNVSQREEGYGKIKLHHLHCHSELLLQETVYP